MVPADGTWEKLMEMEILSWSTQEVNTRQMCDNLMRGQLVDGARQSSVFLEYFPTRRSILNILLYHHYF